MINQPASHDTPDRDNESEPITWAQVTKNIMMLSVIVATTVGGCINRSKNGKKSKTEATPTMYQPGPEIFRGNEFMPSAKD